MMRRIIGSMLIFSTLMSLMSQIVWARPPSLINLNYDKEKEILHIEIQHPSNREDFIRLILVYLNKDDPLEFKFNKQTSRMWLIQEIPLKTHSGDTIRVKAVCNKGGYKEELLSIP